MKVAGLAWTSFRLPFRAVYQTSIGELTHRDGLLLCLGTDSGIVGIGEATPHPAAEPEAARTLEEALADLAPDLLGVHVEGLNEALRSAPPALACAIDIAACDALARAAGVSIARFLSERPRVNVPVNATVAVADENEAVAQARAAREAGFACVKLKVGIACDLDQERQRVSAVRRALGDEVRLRIDANGAWKEERAIATIRGVEECALEYVEQPVGPGDLGAMARVRAAVSVPIAADEDVTSLESARRVLEADAADLLVVKPIMVGGLRPARQIAKLAAETGVATVVTTTIDAGVGTAAALQLAATLPSDSPACGLATGALLADDLVVAPLAVRAGRMAVPDGPGLGVELDETKLAQYGGSTGEVS